VSTANSAQAAKALGRHNWAIAGGHIPLDSCGPEPQSTSYDRICLLNTTDEEALVEMTIVYADTETAGPYRLRIGARRVRHVRFNDLIDPVAIELDTDYAVLVSSDRPIVVQFSRQDTGHPMRALLGTLSYGGDDAASASAS
jgi:hypothetical protein